MKKTCYLLACLLMMAGVRPAYPEAMLQYFNTNWREITEKMPELAEAGYSSLWIPPPTKASGGLSVGYDLWDPFDLGGRETRGTVTTRYGTEAELLNMIETAHRFGIRVYADNIMNHRAFDIPGFNETTPVDIYPGMVPEDFHLRRTEDGFYRKWDNTRDWNDAWQVMHLGLSDLIDIAHETPNQNHGLTEGSWNPKPSIVRHPNNPEFYDRMPNTNAPPNLWNPFDWTGNTNANIYIGFGPDNGLTSEIIKQYPDFFREDVGAYLNRAVRWKMDVTRLDGLRLDAVKHVPDYFFGAFGDDASNAGYIGNVQWQFNMTRGFSDWGNHRDSNFNTEIPRDDALVFGEHLGEPPGYGGYIAAGMRLVDNDLRSQLNNRLGNPSAGLEGYDNPGWGGFAPNIGIMHAQSHDSDFAARRELQHAFYFLREGIGLLYTDGNYHAETLGESGGAFPRHANTSFLGQWNDNRVPNLLYIHEQFGRGYQRGVWSDGDYVAWERLDYRQSGSTAADHVTMLVMLNDNYSAGQSRDITGNISFPAVAGGAYGEDAYLYNYSSYGDGFYTYASALGSQIVPEGGYFVFGYKNPDPSPLWAGRTVSIYDDGQLVETVKVDRKDGPNGDAGFNPYGLPDEVTDDFTYSIEIPRITKGTNVVFNARVDGSAYNVLMRLNGGIDLNGATHSGGDLRDNPPGLSNDIYLGYEGVDFVQRIEPELFAATNAAYAKIGSQGATTYQITIGQNNPTHTASSASNNFTTGFGQISFIYHNPPFTTDVPAGGILVFTNVYGPVTFANATTRGGFSASGSAGSFNNGAVPLGANTIGLWANSGGLSVYSNNFPAPVAAGQYLLFDYQNGGVDDPGASIGWNLIDASGNELITLAFNQGESNYKLFQGATTIDTGIGWMNTAQDARIQFTTATNVTITLNGAASFTRTLAAPVSRVRFYNSSAGETSARNYYINNIRLAEVDESASGPEVTNQFYLTSTSVVVLAKTSQNNDIKTALYYTTDGATFPEGAGGSGANRATRAVPGVFMHDGDSAGTAWWKFEFPRPANGAVLRYKVGAYRPQGFGGNPFYSIWPGGPGDISKKLVMMSEWQTSGQNLKTKSYHRHNDYNSWTTGGLPDGMHLITARAFVRRDDGAAVYNTFKQTFYLDTETPQGYFQFPASNNDTLGGTEYGVVLRTDPTVREVWYRFVDSDASNDNTNNANGSGDVWLLANRTTPSDMDRDHPQAWRFTYANIPTGGTAQIQVRLREWSSAPRTAWTNAGMTAESGHFTELTRTVNTRGDAFRLYFDYPAQDGDLVEAGWTVVVKYSAPYAEGIDGNAALDLFTIRLNSTENGGPGAEGIILDKSEINITHNWDWPNLNTISFTMPNVYNGQPDWLHSFEITAERAGYPTLRATRQVKTRGELLPSIIINQPPEVGSDGRPYEIILPDVPAAELATNPSLRTTTIQLSTSTNAVETGIVFTSPTGYTGTIGLVGTNIIGGTSFWTYQWSNLVAGTYRFTAWVVDGEGGSNTASRTARLKLLQVVEPVTNKLDWDDDGLINDWENTVTPLPFEAKPNPELWLNGEVHAHYAFGRSLPESPDSDGDGLPDALELGWRIASTSTVADVDTNGDGWPNFIADLDPPFYNTLDNFNRVPGVDSQSKGGDRARRVRGTMTDPNNPDTDGDGIPDGIEDANRNGWVDGDGEPIQPDWDPWMERDWPDGEWDELWAETDPNNPDTDGDGLSDGFGEDKNFNGYLDVGLVDNSGNITSMLDNASVPKVAPGSRVIDRTALFAAHPNAVFTETCPLTPDTDGDGLPDGWEVQYGLDPLDSGIIGQRSLRTGLIIESTEHGAAGDPDGDGFSNLVELQNGTNPRFFDDPASPPPAGSITIGRGPALGTINGETFYEEFTDWTADDLIALDSYNMGGSQGADVYRNFNDGFESSRDLVAFYMRDGGAADGRLYFRVDLHDLKAFAEESGLNIYVVMDFNSPGTGERVLPDEVDTLTDMRWEAVAAVYDGNNGNLYVDQNPGNNTAALGDSLSAAGVVAAPGGFLGAYFNSELDAVEFAIDRSALTGIGWNGNADLLNFQVFTVKDNNCNSCNSGSAGPGDIGGRSDITDSIRNNWIASDFWRDQDFIRENGILTQWIGRNADNDMGKSAKIAMLTHGNQHIQPGNVMQNLVDNGEGAGYRRPVRIHGLYGAPLNLHVTPTLAMALEWADVEEGGPSFRSGPALNDLIRELVATNVVSLLASTYSDHVISYFPLAFNTHNVNLASEVLEQIYGADINANSIFWTPERVLNADAFAAITAMGFRYTVLDQNTHIFNWLGRTTSLSDDGYRLNRINGVNCFVINNAADGYRYVNFDSGIAMPMRELFSRRARSGRQDQVSTIFNAWEDFTDLARADAYDRNLRWLANRPWIQLVALEDIAAGNVTLPSGQNWEPIDRGNAATSKQSHDWVNHANNESYDNWYNGSGRHEGLRNKRFQVRLGVNMPDVFGQVGVSGVASAAWARVSSIAHPDVAELAAKVMHASVFQTAFHNEINNDLTRWSFGGYIYPASDSSSLIDFAKVAQSQTRMAAIYAQVDAWAAAASGLTTTMVISVDSDLDGEVEYWLYNQHVAAMFERIGGRMIAAWQRDAAGRVYQMIGNLASYAGSETEVEGATSVDAATDTVLAYRTSALKDWWAGTNKYVNDLYVATTNGVANGWKFTSSDGNISKTITLAPAARAFDIDYVISPSLNSGRLFVRHGLSPDLAGLMVGGQEILSSSLAATGAMAEASATTNAIGVAVTMEQGGINTGAVDDAGASFDTVNLRNQAQTQQIEMEGTQNLSFSMAFYVTSGEEPPATNDGVPVDWLTGFGYAADVNVTNTMAANGVNNLKEAYIAGLNPTNASSVLKVSSSGLDTNGFTITFGTITGRLYSVEFKNALMTGDWSLVGSWLAGQTNPVPGDGATKSVTDTEAISRTNRFYRFKVELE
jgi:hypothetical protein